MTPEVAARAHLESLASRYRLPREAIANAHATQVRNDGTGGVLVVLRQKIGGIDVLERDAKVLMDQSLSLVAIGGAIHPAGFAHDKLGAFSLQAADAIARSIDDLYGTSLSGGDLAPADDAAPAGQNTETSGEYRSFALSKSAASRDLGVRFVRPAHARKVYFPASERLVPAYKVEIFAQAASQPSDDAYAFIVAADDGRILRRTNLTQDAFTYRVYADTTGRYTPKDGPLQDFNPHPTGVPGGTQPSFATPSLITIDGFNSSHDPWLAANASETRGNNADAYIDNGSPDGFSAGDLRATITSPSTFDRVYDPSSEPAATNDQKMAAVTSAFYITNWLHDDWYDVGFDEAAGNAQASNYGRGGKEGDALLVEVQDSFALGSKNNANASTPDDGTSPRLQFYVFDGPVSASLTLTPGGTRQVGVAGFGPKNAQIAGNVVVAVDGGGASTSDGCESFVNNVAGKIVLVDRGTCSFRRKVYNAQSAGAIGVIVANHVAGEAPPMPDESSPTTPEVNIPALSISQADGASLKAAIAAGAVNASLARQQGANRDSGLDANIVAHEWGHYLHHRLVDCGTDQCKAQSEGWGDFVALHMSLRAGDNLSGAFVMSQYASAVFSNDGSYFGIRRFPYSTDFSKNALTFKHITNGVVLPSVPGMPGSNANSEVHNAGEVWAAMMFEGYVALQQRATGAAPAYSFDEARKRMASYVVGGMKLAPSQPTFTEQRDAILAFAAARDMADVQALAAAFARRGAGTCAVSPPRDSSTFEGVVESFEVKPRASIESVVVDDAAASCDSDGYIDSGETGRVVVRIANGGQAPLTGAQVTVTSKLAGTTFPKGATLTVPTVAPYASADVIFEVMLAPSASPKGLDLKVDLAAPSACTTSATVDLVRHTNVDEKPASSAKDDVEASATSWSAKDLDSHVLATSIWKREDVSPGVRAWHATDHPAPSDTALESPSFNVGATPFSVSFSHRYQFEIDDQPYDGAVVEVSIDGADWVDASTLSAPHYGGRIGDFVGSATNALKGRQGYVGQSAGWPARTTETLEFGTALAGKVVKIRFRVGTDDMVGAFGWEIDDIQVTGATNTPFASLVADDGVCTHFPTVRAGADQTVMSGALVTLDGSGSAWSDAGAISFAWTQTDGPRVTLSGAGMTKPTFTAPTVTAETKLSFRLTVHEGPTSAADTVDVRVQPPAEPGGPGPDNNEPTGGDAGASPDATSPADATDDGGCGCRAAGAPPMRGAAGIGGVALAALSLVTRRRRAR
jgi:large repetitive protein